MTSSSTRRWSIAGLFLTLAVASCRDTGPDPGGPDAPPADAVAPARLTLDRTATSFGSRTVATVSPEMYVTVLNQGQSDSGMVGAVLSGTDPTQFKVVNGCTFLAPGGQCIITVAFAPTSVGVKSALLVVSGTPGGMGMVMLDGEGTP